MAFSPPPAAPQRGDRTTFSGRVDAFLIWLTALIPQLNTFLSSITALAAGGANSFSYGFDTSTANGDPGAGRVRFGSTPQNTANVIRVSATPGNGGAIGAFLTALQAGTSNVKASVRFQKVGDVTTYLLFDITAVAAVSGYYNLTVTPRTSSAASPFAANDTVVLFFSPKGDKGDSGGTPTQAEIIAAVGTLPISSGGTSATTAVNALAALGGLPRAGGGMSGNLIFDNAIGVFSKDTGGSVRQIFNLGVDNNVNHVNGNGGHTRLFNAAGTTIIHDIDDVGNVQVSGSVQMKNGQPIRMLNNGNNPQNVFVMGSDNNSYENIGSGGYKRWFTFDGANELANLSNAGVFAAVVIQETSDERKKTNWRPLTDEQLDALAEMDLVGVFDWIDGSGTAVGASAQQIQRIVPWAVGEDPDGSLRVAYGGLTFAMAHAALRRAKGLRP